jgi:RHS repeat-associated protein
VAVVCEEGGRRITTFESRQYVSEHNYDHADHLNTPRLVANQSGQTVWRWDQQEPFGNNPADENPSGLGAFDLPLRLPGQYFDKETGLHYNYYRDFDPSLGIYKQSDPIGLKGGLNTYVYGYANPLALIDPKGLEVEVGVRPFYPVGFPLVRHCFVRFSGNSSSTLSFTPSGVGPDANPGGATYSPTVGPENDSCVRAEMLKCRDYAFFTNNCCDCVGYALDACGLSKVGPWPNLIPAGPFRQPPPPPMCGDQGCQFP